jgi:hypothetical protein
MATVVISVMGFMASDQGNGIHNPKLVRREEDIKDSPEEKIIQVLHDSSANTIVADSVKQIKSDQPYTLLYN